MSETPGQMNKLLEAVAALTDEMQALKREIHDVKTSVNETKEIVEAWEAVKLGGRFVKWLAGLGSGIAGLWIMAKAIGMSWFK